MSASTTTPTSTTPRVGDDPPAEGRSAELHRLTRANRWLALMLAVAVVAIAAAVLFLDGSPSTTRADAASTARLDAATAQYEAERTARANAAWTARLDTATAQYEAERTARANAAWTARLDAAAAHHDPTRRAVDVADAAARHTP